MEANGRFINHLPGCRQVTILTPLAARLLLPDSRAFGLGTFWLSPAQCREYRAAKLAGASVRERMRRPDLEAR